MKLESILKSHSILFIVGITLFMLCQKSTAQTSDQVVLKNMMGFLPREAAKSGLKLGGSFTSSMLASIESQAGKCINKVHVFNANATIYNCGDSQFSFKNTRLSFTVKHGVTDHLQANPSGTVIALYSWIPCREIEECKFLSMMAKPDYLKKEMEHDGSIFYKYRSDNLKAEIVDSTRRTSGTSPGMKFEWSIP